MALLSVRVVGKLGRLRRDPARAGEALLLAGMAVTLGIIWYGGYVRVPRYLLPLIPLLALVLARTAQLSWRWTRVGTIAWVTGYLVAVGMDLVPDITALHPAARLEYRQGRQADAQLFDFLRANDLRHAYAFTYWLAPRLTFDGGGDIVVAQAFDERYPPYARAVDQSSRPAYVLRGGAEVFRNWLAGMQVGAWELDVGGYRVFDHFTPPPEVLPLPRAGWTVRASPGRGDPMHVADARLDTGWSSGPGPAGSAWVEVDLGVEGVISGVTLVNDRVQRLPTELVVWADQGGTGSHRVATFAPLGVTPRWENGAPRFGPSRALTVRFDPVTTRRIRLGEAGPAGRWSVAELFLLGPAPAGSSPGLAAGPVHDGR